MTAPDEQAAESRLRAELAALPELPMPPDVADRITLALSAPPAGTPRIRRRTGPRVALGAAASLAALVLGLSLTGPGRPLPVNRDDDLRSTGHTAFGQDGAGMLADPARRRDCLATAGVPEPDAVLLGGVPYSVDGTPGTLLVLGTDVTGRYRMVVVDAGCRRVLAGAVTGR